MTYRTPRLRPGWWIPLGAVLGGGFYAALVLMAWRAIT